MEGKSPRGFTLIEMLVTIGLLAILSSIAVPSYRNFLASNRAATEINSFVADFQYAKSAAMQNGTAVTLCVSDDGKTCTAGSGATSCTGDGARWNDGWIVFSDPDGDNIVDDGETVLRVHAALPGGDCLIGNGGITAHIIFNRFGMAPGSSGTITLVANPVRTANLRCVVISIVGKLRSASGSDCKYKKT